MRPNFIMLGRQNQPRPDANVSDAEWIDWLTVPVNPIGYVEEKWWHAKGCGKWFTLTRHTVTHGCHHERNGGQST